MGLGYGSIGVVSWVNHIDDRPIDMLALGYSWPRAWA